MFSLKIHSTKVGNSKKKTPTTRSRVTEKLSEHTFQV